MSTSSLGVLLVSGLRTHQESYAPNFRRDSRCHLVALTDETDISPLREELNRKYAESLGIPYIPNLEQALDDDAVDIVSICAEPERRARIAVRCAQAGKHLYLDKPLTPYLAAADEVVNAVEAQGVRSQMFSTIHQPWARRAKAIVDSGELGELVALHADCLFAKGPAGTAALGRPRQTSYPPTISNFVDAKAELYAMGVYALGLVLWLSQGQVESVYGRTANYFFAAHQKHDVEDLGFLVLNLRGGITATITGGRIGWASHAAGGANQVNLIGTERTLLIDAYTPRLEVHDSAPPWTAPVEHPDDPMGFWRSTTQQSGAQPKRAFIPLTTGDEQSGDESHFVDCILAEREPAMNARMAGMLTEVLLAGYKSAASDAVVHLPLPRP